MELSIPVCLQVLSVPGRYIKGDNDKLTDLYLGNGGELVVEYSSEANCEAIKNIHMNLVKVKNSLHSLTSPGTDVANDFRYKMAYLSYTCLLPWKSERSTANAMYLDQLGVFSLLVDVLKSIEAKPSLTEADRFVISNTLSVFWNLAETTERQNLVLKHNGFQLMLRLLAKKSFNFYGYAEVVVGCVTNYCETVSCRLQLANNQEAVNQLLMFGNQVSKKSFEKILVSNAFFRMSFSMETHPLLGTKETLQKLLDFGYKELDKISQDARYSCVLYTLLLALCRFTLLSSISKIVIDQEIVKGTCELVKKYLDIAEVKTVRAFENKIDNNWNSIMPFLELAYLPSHPLLHRGTSFRTTDIVILKKLIIFSLIVELGRERSQIVAMKECVQEYIICLVWLIQNYDETMKKEYLEVLINKKGFFKDSVGLCVPSLSTLSRAVISEFIGLQKALMPAAQIAQLFL